MDLILPTPSVTPGPTWAAQLNAALTLIDGHRHTPGQGALITPAAISINADLPCNGNNLNSVRALRFGSQAGALPNTGLDITCLYAVGNDLYYNDGSTSIQITAAGALSASSLGGITGLSAPAAVSYNSGAQTLTFSANTGTSTPASIDAAQVVVREANVAAPHGITLKSPTSLAADYSLTFPAALPASTNVLTLNSGGAIAAAVNVALPGTLSTSALATLASLTVTGAATLNSTLAVTGAATLNSTLTAGDSISTAGSVLVDSGAVNSGAYTPGLTLGAAGIGIASKKTSGGFQSGIDFYTSFQRRMTIKSDGSVDLASGSLTTGGAASIGSTLAVTGAATITGAVTLSSTVHAVGATTLDSTLSVNGTVNVNGHLIQNVTNPSAAQDAATKSYVDTTAASLLPGMIVCGGRVNSGGSTVSSKGPGITASIRTGTGQYAVDVTGLTATAILVCTPNTGTGCSILGQAAAGYFTVTVYDPLGTPVDSDFSFIVFAL
jgi:hypothetical protein